MAQFDVFRNNGARRGEIPFVVVVQSRRLDTYTRRLVVPLVRRDLLRSIDPTLNPCFPVAGVAVVLHPLEMVSVPVTQLGEQVGHLRDAGDAIITAIDMVIARAWG